jgi:hypothetical protein
LTRARALLAVACATACVPLHAFEVVPTDLSPPPVDDHAPVLKWGPSAIAGTTGGVVTWGFVSEGTPGGRGCGWYCDGDSIGALPHFYPAPGCHNETRSLPLALLQPIFEAAFAAWSAAADIHFRYVGVDASRRAPGDPAAQEPMIRIALYRFGGMNAYFVAGGTFAPPPNAGTLAGDIFLNANVGYQLAGYAGEACDAQSFPAGGGRYLHELASLALHETGHAIGLGGSHDPDAVMNQGEDDAAMGSSRVRHLLRPDDVAGVRFLYGAPRAAESVPR